MAKDIYSGLMYARSWRVLGGIAYYALKLLGVEIPRGVKIGKDVTLVHGGFGVVLHPDTVIGDRVKIYPGVNLGRADIHKPIEESEFKGIVVEEDVILSPGSKVLCKSGVLTIARGTILGANAVLLNSTGVGEIWAGVPAKNVGKRDEN